MSHIVIAEKQSAITIHVFTCVFAAAHATVFFSNLGFFTYRATREVAIVAYRAGAKVSHHTHTVSLSRVLAAVAKAKQLPQPHQFPSQLVRHIPLFTSHR